jgi:hypothetical protein
MSRSHSSYKPLAAREEFDEKEFASLPTTRLYTGSFRSTTGAQRYGRRYLSTRTIHLMLLIMGLALIRASLTLQSIRLKNSNSVGHRNSTYDTLPSHYILPSGDAIPALALGTAPSGVITPSSWS